MIIGLCKGEKLDEFGNIDCYLELNEENEDKGSYLHDWEVNVKQNREESNGTEEHTMLKTNTFPSTVANKSLNDMESVVRGSPWKYRRELNNVDNWITTLLGITTIKDGYEFVLSRNSSVAIKQIALISSSSWIDDKTNEIILNGVLMMPNQQSLVKLHLMLQRMNGFKTELFILRRDELSHTSWFWRIILILLCIKWLFSLYEAFHCRDRLVHLSQTIPVTISLFIAVMFFIEFMKEDSLEKVIASLQIDKRLYKIVLYKNVLKIIQGIVTLLLAFRIVQLFAFANAIQQIKDSLKFSVHTIISILLLYFLLSFALLCCISITHWGQRDEFKSVFTNLIVLSLGCGRWIKHFPALRFLKPIVFLITVIITFMKYMLFGFLFAEFRGNINLIQSNKEINGTNFMENQKRTNADSKNVKNVKKNWENSALNSEKKKIKFKGSKLIRKSKPSKTDGCSSTNAKIIEDCLNARISETLVCLNEQYLGIIMWDAFLLDIALRLRKKKCMEGTTNHCSEIKINYGIEKGLKRKKKRRRKNYRSGMDSQDCLKVKTKALKSKEEILTLKHIQNL